MLIDSRKLEITVQSGKFTIDADDISKIVGYNWRVFKIGNTHYVKAFEYSAGKPRNTYYIHRIIMGLGKEKDGIVVDHIDGNGLNNSKENLRTLDRGQNCARSVNRKNKDFKGLNLRGSSYYVYVQHLGKKYHVGKFEDKIIAAMAYDKAAIDLLGDLAVLNLPDLVCEHENLKLRDYRSETT